MGTAALNSTSAIFALRSANCWLSATRTAWSPSKFVCAFGVARETTGLADESGAAEAAGRADRLQIDRFSMSRLRTVLHHHHLLPLRSFFGLLAPICSEPRRVVHFTDHSTFGQRV